jgi:hypothetical protein
MRYLGGATTVLVDPSGADCMPGGLCPCGLSAGAPPDFVSSGPVQPCGCNWPLSSGGERPVGVLTSLFGSVCAAANPHEKVRQIAIIRSRMANLRFADSASNERGRTSVPLVLRRARATATNTSRRSPLRSINTLRRRWATAIIFSTSLTASASTRLILPRSPWGSDQAIQI